MLTVDGAAAAFYAALSVAVLAAVEIGNESISNGRKIKLDFELSGRRAARRLPCPL